MSHAVLRRLIRDTIRIMLHEANQPVVTGILKLLPDNIEDVIAAQQELAQKFPDLVAIAPDKLHVTMLHQSLAKKLKGVTLPQFEGKITLGSAYLVERGEKKSVFITVNEQDALRDYVKALGVEPEQQRIYHISILNKTGSPMDSVGHTEAEPIMSGAKPA